jgi:hypothetical protein
MTQGFEYPNISWPMFQGFDARPDLDEALAAIADERYVLGHPEYSKEMLKLAQTNGALQNESEVMLHNALILSMSRLPEAGLARLRPEMVLPVATSAMQLSNNFARKYPLQRLAGSPVPGLTHVTSIDDAASQFLNVRSQNIRSDEVEFDPAGLKALGLDRTQLQPFLWLFVERCAPYDTLLRFYNPFKTTLLTSVEQALQGQLGATQKPALKHGRLFGKF